MKAPRYLALAACGVALLAAASSERLALHLVYNATDSAPHGWYRVAPAERLQVGDYVIARLPHTAAELAAGRGYLPRSLPIVKPVAALAGQVVCVRDDIVTIDGQARARLLATDRRGRPLVAWRQCRALVAGEVFLLSTTAAASFDSRYFGPIDQSFVGGRAVRLSVGEQ